MKLFLFDNYVWFGSAYLFRLVKLCKSSRTCLTVGAFINDVTCGVQFLNIYGAVKQQFIDNRKF